MQRNGWLSMDEKAKIIVSMHAATVRLGIRPGVGGGGGKAIFSSSPYNVMIFGQLFST